MVFSLEEHKIRQLLPNVKIEIEVALGSAHSEVNGKTMTLRSRVAR